MSIPKELIQEALHLTILVQLQLVGPKHTGHGNYSMADLYTTKGMAASSWIILLCSHNLRGSMQ